MTNLCLTRTARLDPKTIVNVCLSITIVVFVTIATLGLFASHSPVHAQEERANRYLLGPGDKLRVNVYEEDELSGEFLVDDFGTVSLPLIGEVLVGGNDIRSAERLIESMLKNGFLKRPQVSIEVLNFRPFYILGEVNSPGEYEFVTNMSILKAVALAGGFTYRANKKDFVIIRAKDDSRAEAEVDSETIILPGDIVRVKERFF